MNTATDLTAVYEELQRCKSTLSRMEAQLVAAHCPENIRDKIKRIVCAEFHITLDELASHRRPAYIAWPRQVAMFLARELTTMSFEAVAREFHMKDHATVYHAVKRVSGRLATEPKAKAQLEALRERIINP